MRYALSPALRSSVLFSTLMTASATILLGATLPASAASQGVKCWIRTTPSADLLTIQAMARSDTPLQGRYSFLLDKNSEAGSSRNVQGGQFGLSGGQDEVLTTVTLEGSAQGHFTAELTLDWSQGRTSCRSP